MTTIEAAIIAVEDRDEAVVRARLAEARPDLALLSPDEEVPAPDRAALIAFRPPEAPARFEGVAWVHCAGAGADKLLSGLGFRPPLMTRTVGRMGQQIGEYVAAYFLAELQKTRLRESFQDEARWEKALCMPGYAFEARALVLGTGGIGSGVAATLAALGVGVDGVSRSGRARVPFGTVYAADDLPETLHGYGLIVCALPATPATRGFVGLPLLAKVRDALLVSVGRGSVVDHDAVLTALADGRLCTAVLDVFEAEPLPPASPLWRAGNVLVTPHVSGVTRPGDIADAFLTALAAIDRGEVPALVVDQDAGY